jgi:hypothetical protein
MTQLGNINSPVPITANQLQDGLITSVKIADGQVTEAKVASGAITSAKIGDSQITAAKIATNAVETAKIANANVTSAKLETAVARGVAKAWANLNGTGTIALRDSLNVSSVVDNGTGDYTFNFASAMLNTNYATVFDGGVFGVTFGLTLENIRLVGSVSIGTFSLAGASQDTSKSRIVANGDLA